MRWKRVWKKIRNNEAEKFFVFVFFLAILIASAYIPQATRDAVDGKVIDRLTNELVQDSNPSAGCLTSECTAILKSDWLVVPQDVLIFHRVSRYFDPIWAIPSIVGLVLYIIIMFVLIPRIADYRHQLINAKIIQKAWYDSFLYRNFGGWHRVKSAKEFDGM